MIIFHYYKYLFLDASESHFCLSYSVFNRLNSRVVNYIERRKKNSGNLGNGTASNTDIDDGCDATVVLLKKGERNGVCNMCICYLMSHFNNILL